MKEAFETVKLLASKTEQVEAIGRHYLMQGQTVQLAALLLVAWDKLVEPFSDQGIKGCPIGQLILCQLQHYQEACIYQSSDTSPEFYEYGANLENAWKVLELLDIARDTIHKCWDTDVLPHDVPFSVACELNRIHNICLEHEDLYANDVNCLKPRVSPQHKAWLFRTIDKKIRSVSTLPTSSEILPTLSERRGAERVGSWHFFSTVPPNMIFGHSFLTVAPNTTLRRCTNRVGSSHSHSLHTLVPNMNVVKPVASELSKASQNSGTFSRGITSRMSRLLSALKRI